jgi:hypothetical protein
MIVLPLALLMVYLFAMELAQALTAASGMYELRV